METTISMHLYPSANLLIYLFFNDQILLDKRNDDIVFSEKV
jgi:hypothetical protein